MNVRVLAFGFKFGVPEQLDLLFDVRFLRNPNYVPHLQQRTGDDAEAATFIEADPALEPFLSRLCSLLDFLLPHYAKDGRELLTIGIGCTGGRHRSVYVAARLLQHLEQDRRWTASRLERDLERTA